MTILESDGWYAGHAVLSEAILGGSIPMKKRFLTMLLAVLLVASLVPMAAMADCNCGLANGTRAEYAGDGKHNILCEHGKVVNNTYCIPDADGVCTACGHAKCDHTLKNYEQTATGHKVTCDCGEQYKYEYCTYDENGVCKCGKVKPAATPVEPVKCDCTEGMGVGAEYVGGGKHNILCQHKNVVNTTWCNDIDGDGYCDACLNKMEAKTEEPEKCDCTEGMGVRAEYVGGGKHDIYCRHGNVVNTTWCSKGDDGKCIGCGHVMEETEPTEKPAVDSEGLDNVPKTGDNGSLIVVTSMTVLAAIAGAAFVFSKKKAF